MSMTKVAHPASVIVGPKAKVRVKRRRSKSYRVGPVPNRREPCGTTQCAKISPGNRIWCPFAMAGCWCRRSRSTGRSEAEWLPT